VLEWAQTIATITIASFLAGISSWLTLGGLASIFGTSGFLVNLFEMCVAGGMGLVTFALLTIVLKIPEANILANQIRTKLGR
ncbi:MAG: lipid II flippase MurJ, partial [Cyanobacteria bacterium J06607_10]